MRMNVAGNWFKLNDPEHLVFHTNRLMEQGRKVQEVRQAVLDLCSAQQYRGADLRVLQAKLAQLEAMLPMQSKVIQLPFENSASGFDLFSEGATALVPELTGYSGVDVIQAPAAGDGLGHRRPRAPRRRRAHGSGPDHLDHRTRHGHHDHRDRRPRRASPTSSSSASTSACSTPG